MFSEAVLCSLRFLRWTQVLLLAPGLKGIEAGSLPSPAGGCDVLAACAVSGVKLGPLSALIFDIRNASVVGWGLWSGTPAQQAE